MARLAFAWPGLTDYAARCIREVMFREGEMLPVVATRPAVPIEDIESSLGQPALWVHADDAEVSWKSLGAARPEVLFVGGYGTVAFETLAEEVRQAAGHVILMSDNNWQRSVWQRSLSSVRHRLLLRSRYDGIFVPGAAGRKVARSWGYQDEVTSTGLYGADPRLFHGGPPLTERPKTFLFVGQFIARKNVLGLVDAFAAFAADHDEWSLTLCGSGWQKDVIGDHPRVRVHGFVQPSGLAILFRSVRCLVLPSLEEHWGLVVHEAVSSGCALALTHVIGAAEDLACTENSVLFPPGKTLAIAHALSEIAGWDDDQWAAAERASRERALGFGPKVFADSVYALIDRISEVKDRR